MVHDWVLERLAQEKLDKPEISGEALCLLSELHDKLQTLFDSSSYQSVAKKIKIAEEPATYKHSKQKPDKQNR